jgi:hypothetical protein
VVSVFAPDQARSLDGPEWLREWRRDAAERVSASPLPTADEEVWRYSRIGDLATEVYRVLYEAKEPRAAVNDLMLRDEEPETSSERTKSSVRELASRIPESLSAIGRDISRTIEKAMSAKDEYVVAVKVSPEAQDKLEQLVQAGVFHSRVEAAGFLIDEGIRVQAALFERVEQKLAEIERLRAELRGLISERPS